MIEFDQGEGGYMGLQRAGGRKQALVSIWGALAAKAGVLTPEVNCNENGACQSLKGGFDWKVGHQYRFRVERSPRTASDSTGDWWQITLADLTTGTVDILGEIKTGKRGLSRGNGTFLEYFQGPYQCNALRYTKATLGAPQGNYGVETTLLTSNGDAYDQPHACGTDSLLPGMSEKDSGSYSWITNGTLTHVGNNYRGIHAWGQYQRQARAGMFFTADPDSDRPYVYQAKHDGAYWYFPAAGADNADWKSIGRGAPIINDLYFRGQRLYDWDERNAAYVNVGDYFEYQNPYDGDLEYFVLLRKGAQYFPTDRSSNADWRYVGRYPRKEEPASEPMTVHTWDSNQPGKKGWLYVYPGNPTLYFRLKQDGGYWYFPTTPTDNEWWQFVGYHD